MAELTQITPFVRVSNMDRAVSFYSSVLGFSVGFRGYDPDYAFLRRDQVAIRLLIAGDNIDLSHPSAQQTVYIDVRDVDGLYTELEPQLGTLPKGRVRAPFDQSYGQRELHVIDEDTTLLMFGERIAGHPGQRQTPAEPNETN